MVAKVDYILGIDVGVASLGVVLLDVDAQGRPTGIRHGGAFIYPSGGDETAERRLARATRKRYQRRRRRLKDIRALLGQVIGAGEGFDVDTPCDSAGHAATSRVALRARGLNKPLAPDDLARAVMHIARNRGMRLTRVLGEDADSEKARQELGQMARESRETEARMAARNMPTPGAFLHALESEAAADHLRPPTRRRRGGTGEHRFLRTQVQDELDRLLDAQAPHHPGLTPEVRRDLAALVFHEHPLTPPDVGPCRYFPFQDSRMRVATDLYQTKRILEEVNNIRVRYNDGSAEKLTQGQRDGIAAELLEGRSLTAAAIRKRLGLKGAGVTISLDDRSGTQGPELKGHAVRAALRGTALEAVYADAANRSALDTLLREERDLDVLAGRLMEAHGLDEEEAWRVARVLVPTGTAPMGETAARAILAELKADVISHTEAVDRAGLTDPEAEGKRWERLPYYGVVFPHLVRKARVTEGRPGFGHPAAPLEIRYGRLPNPVVHKAFNALRQVVNGILKTEGPPLRVQVELARDMKKTQEQREEDQKKIARARSENEEFDRITLSQGRQPSRKNRRRLRLAKLQNWCCPYTGRQISVETLFDGTFDIDHILPRAKTLDDSLGNLVVALEVANSKHKLDRSPYEAFANGYTDPKTGETSTWEQIVKRVRGFKDARRRLRRFQPDAMARFEDQDAFRKRFETDTTYIAKWAAQYLRLICPDVRVVNGHIVHEVRHQWGLSTLVAQIQAEEDGRTPEEIAAEMAQETEEARNRKKSRSDHRHHVLDALVTAATPLSVVQQLQTAAGRGRRREDGPAVTPPGGLAIRAEAEQLLRRVRVTHRRDRAVNKRLHNEMAWGVLARFADGTCLARRRLRLTDDTFSTIKKLDDLLVPEELVQRLAAELGSGQALMFWKADDPVAALRAIAEDQSRLRDRLLALYEAEPEVEEVPLSDGSATRARKRPEPERLAAALEAYRAETGRRSAITFARRTLFLMGWSGAPGERPKLAYETKGNAWLDIRRADDGTVTWEAVPRIIALNPPPDTAEERPDLRVFAGDTLEVTDAEGQRRLCRVLSISTGDVQLLPVNDARSPKETPHRSAFRYKSLGRFLAAQPVQVVCDPLGAVVWRDRRRNW